MNEDLAAILASINISLISKGGFYELDFFRLMKLEEQGWNVRNSIESIQGGEILKRYDVYVGDKIRARDIGEALERRTDFIFAKNRESLDSFRLSCASDSVQALLKEDSEFFVRADRAVFAKLNAKDPTAPRMLPYSHPDNLVGRIFWACNTNNNQKRPFSFRGWFSS